MPRRTILTCVRLRCSCKLRFEAVLLVLEETGSQLVTVLLVEEAGSQLVAVLLVEETGSLRDPVPRYTHLAIRYWGH